MKPRAQFCHGKYTHIIRGAGRIAYRHSGCSHARATNSTVPCRWLIIWYWMVPADGSQPQVWSCNRCRSKPFIDCSSCVHFRTRFGWIQYITSSVSCARTEAPLTYFSSNLVLHWRINDLKNICYLRWIRVAMFSWFMEIGKLTKRILVAELCLLFINKCRYIFYKKISPSISVNMPVRIEMNN